MTSKPQLIIHVWEVLHRVSAVILAPENGGLKKQHFYVVGFYAKRSAFLQQTFRFYRQRDGFGIIPVIINGFIQIFMS